MISIKIHSSYRTVVAICDLNLIGKKFEQGNRQLDLKENFYKGKSLNPEQAVKIIQEQTTEDATFNIVGKESIKAAIDAKAITQESVDKIQEIPFALTFL